MCSKGPICTPLIDQTIICISAGSLMKKYISLASRTTAPVRTISTLGRMPPLRRQSQQRPHHNTTEIENVIPSTIIPKKDGNQVKIEKSAVYRQALQSYFDSNNFQFDPAKQKQQIQYLRKCMELVFLRERPLISIDIEAWEVDNEKITEIGIAIYDPREEDFSMLPMVHGFHLIIEENEGKFNGRFVPDNKFNHLRETSYCMNLSQCTIFLNLIIDRYFKENIGVFVGHGLVADERWLSSMGVKFPKYYEKLDTSDLFKLTQSYEGNLRGILRRVDIPHGRLHNAANDAYYTLLAVMAYCTPSTRILKGLDIFHTKPESYKKSKKQKRRDTLFDKAEIVEHKSGKILFRSLFG